VTKKLTIALAVCLLLLGVGGAGAAPYVYSELTPPGGLIPFGINRSGTIIGQSYADNPSFEYSDGTYTLLNDPLARMATTYAYGINDAGTIVGSYAVGDVAHGFFYANGMFTTFNVPGALNTALTGINNAGTFWGGYDNHTFVDQRGVILTDPFIGGIAGINDHGVVAGNYTDSAGVNHGYVYANGVYTTIDAPGGGVTTLTGINDAGDVVGIEELGCCTQYSFVDKDGVFTTSSSRTRCSGPLPSPMASAIPARLSAPIWATVSMVRLRLVSPRRPLAGRNRLPNR